VCQSGHPDETHVLGLGDQLVDRTALFRSSHDRTAKSVKFVEHPTVDQLVRQLWLVSDVLPQLASWPHTLDLQLSLVQGIPKVGSQTPASGTPLPCSVLREVPPQAGQAPKALSTAA
jgi:hypothetical protein